MRRIPWDILLALLAGLGTGSRLLMGDLPATRFQRRTD